MQAYGQWKESLVIAIERYREWLERHEMGEPEDELHIYNILANLRSDKLTIAFVAEFARGKTELINAIFFSEYDRRLLPSSAGRTTMCPTELLYDARERHSYIRLLPIETRLTETPIAEYKNDPIQWTSIELDLENPASMAEAFQEVVATKMVSLDTARELGLYSDGDSHLMGSDGSPPVHIEIPMWRHALISFPHPLLKQGLVILDTPGLNALGSEPELTLNMLPNAQAVMFVISADSGVTKSDLEMWTLNVRSLMQMRGGKGVTVILNKVDTLWDDLKSDADVDASIQKQCQDAAKTLGIDVASVIPASAQKGLLAKIRHDQPLLQRSNIGTLEGILANDVVPMQQELIRSHIEVEIGDMIRTSHGQVTAKLTNTKKQLMELQELRGQNAEVIEHLMQKTREEQVSYHENIKSFNMNKKLLSQQSKELLEFLSLTKFDQLVSRSRHEMSDSWTTAGLKKGMLAFFGGVNQMFDEVTEYSEQLNRLVTTLYRRFHVEHGIPEIDPVLFEPQQYLKELEQLNHSADEFRSSPVTTMTEQSFVIKKFFITLVSHARNIFFKAHRDAEAWSKAVLTPLVKHIKARKGEMESRLENLRQVSHSHATLQEQMDKIKRLGGQQKAQYDEVHAIYQLLNIGRSPR